MGYGSIPSFPQGTPDGTACFVSAYAPTETNSTELELEVFYSDLRLALSEARKSGGRVGVPVLGDFNINLGSDVGMLGAASGGGIFGKCLRLGISSPRSDRFVEFCVGEGLSAIQTFEDPRALLDSRLWQTWCHPGTKSPHMKDFVLIPKEEKTAIRFCRPFPDADIINNDHALIVCKVNSSRAHMEGLRRKFASMTAPPVHRPGKPSVLPHRRRTPNLDSRLRGLDFSTAKKRQAKLGLQAAFEERLRGLDAGWSSTEQALKESAVKVLPALVANHEDSWLTATATAEMGALIKQGATYRRLLSRACPATMAHLRGRKREVKKALRKCKEKHLRAYRQRLANVATLGRDLAKRRLAIRRLAQGTDVTAEINTRRQEVPPEQFKAHFENLFSKKSDKETLGLTAERVGPKSAPKMELSGPPTLNEVQYAIGKLKSSTAPGANGLRPEIFKACGRSLARRLVRDFWVIWPSGKPGRRAKRFYSGHGASQRSQLRENSESDRVKVFQTWQNAEIVTLYKHKGARNDPNSYRGIFLLDVAGKIFATVIERRLKRAADEWLSDYQNGFRERRSTSHAIHVIRRVQEAVRTADLTTSAVFVDFAKAFDSPPRAALFECLEWIGVPPDVLSVVEAIHYDPKGKIIGTNVWFDVARGVRQGCVLGPTMFIILLEFCIRMSNLNELGVEFRCVEKKELSLPADLRGVTFRVGLGGYADDLVLISTTHEALSEALNRLQLVCGSIGLNVSPSKTEWMYLHHSVHRELDVCRANRSGTSGCCRKIFLGSMPINHVSCFKYLGSVISEHGGVKEDNRLRLGLAKSSLHRFDGIWNSEMSLRRKIRFLKTYVIPILVYGAECGNHKQADVGKISAFLNQCRRKLLGVFKNTGGVGEVTTNENIAQRCKLPSALDLLAIRRLVFCVFGYHKTRVRNREADVLCGSYHA